MYCDEMWEEPFAFEYLTVPKLDLGVHPQNNDMKSRSYVL